MREKAKEIASEKQAELTKITNANLNEFRTPRAFHAALRRVTNMPDQAALRAWIDSEWKKRSDAVTAGKKATVWKTEWRDIPLYLYNNMMKAEATALFLLRTEVLGLNCWLASVGVQGVLPYYIYGWGA